MQIVLSKNFLYKNFLYVSLTERYQQTEIKLENGWRSSVWLTCYWIVPTLFAGIPSELKHASFLLLYAMNDYLCRLRCNGYFITFVELRFMWAFICNAGQLWFSVTWTPLSLINVMASVVLCCVLCIVTHMCEIGASDQ